MKFTKDNTSGRTPTGIKDGRLVATPSGERSTVVKQMLNSWQMFQDIIVRGCIHKSYNWERI